MHFKFGSFVSWSFQHIQGSTIMKSLELTMGSYPNDCYLSMIFLSHSLIMSTYDHG
jgi:hypothetical protein